jgi:hypothetical protein
MAKLTKLITTKLPTTPPAIATALAASASARVPRAAACICSVTFVLIGTLSGLVYEELVVGLLLLLRVGVFDKLVDGVPELLGDGVPELLGDGVPELLGDGVPELLGDGVPELLGET